MMRNIKMEELFTICGGTSIEENLKNHLGTNFKIISSTPAIWSDSSLGLPTPDGMYAQVINSGAITCVEVDGKQYRYHVSNDFGWVVYAGEC